MEKIIDREVAWRIFAWEFNHSNHYVSEGDERAPNYIITPTGVKCNRLFIVGVVTEVENIGQDNNLWRARIADPTGVFTVYAGQYQPEAAIFLSELNVPAYVAVVGKARKYEPGDGSIYTSVRPEEINIAEEKLRDRWVLDTAERTLERLRILEEATDSGLSGNELKEFLIKKGTNAVHADGVMRATEHYENMDKMIDELKEVIVHAIKTVASDNTFRPAQVLEKKTETSGQMIDESHEPAEAIAVNAAEPDIKEAAPLKPPEPKEAIADIIEKLDTGKGISYSMVVETALKTGMNADTVEAGIKELMAEGRCYEPKIGVLRKV